MIKIKFTVGKAAINNPDDVASIQQLLNDNIGAMTPYATISVDGLSGSKTIGLIDEFQRRILKLPHPDGRVDPNGKTLQKLNQLAVPEHAAFRHTSIFQPPGLCFPLKFKPTESYKTGMRKFGANRGGGTRKHAASDLYAPIGTPILAMADGVITKGPYAFYLGTQALEVQHKDFIARYGEIQNTATGLKEGSPIKRGQVIAYVGELQGLNMSMLHLELYRGNASGPLTVRGNKPYQRRTDLIDPTSILDGATLCQ